ncbi:hypothetical protein ACFOEK_11055 [Litoribrevibacter euphylliae]|uniref:Uncharacterized protein n=1 Tax=Litoribrevibacter euphylliae TaxID=1834034 RepID=A0ABV7HFZ8_9GAMM
MQLSSFVPPSNQITRTLSSALVALAVALPSLSNAEVVELSPNELNSAYIKDSTIYIPKATREKVAQKIVNVKIRPGEPSPEEVDREEELKEGAAQAVIAGMQTNQSWDATRLESSLANASQPNIQTEGIILPPRDIPGAPDGFELPAGDFEYTVQNLIDQGFTHPQTGQPLTSISDTGQSLNGLAISVDGNNGHLVIPLPADYESRVPVNGINTDVLSINQALQNAINMRLQLPQNQ